MKYTIEELRDLGFTDGQIAAINRASRADGVDDKVVAMPVVDKPPVKVEEIPTRVYADSDVTDFSKLKNVKDSKIVELPEFADGTKFITRLRRPSMLKLCKSGKIPNSLLTQATALFTDSNASRKVNITEIYDICEIICESVSSTPDSLI